MGRNRAFVAPTDFCSHSMLHQTLISPLVSFHPSSLSSLPPLPPFLSPDSLSPSPHQARKRMEAFFSDEETAVAAEKSSVLGEEFVVDDFLDLEGLTEEGAQEEEKRETEEKLVIEEDNSNSSFSSALSFDPAPELSLPAHDAAEFEWVSRFTDDSLSEFPPCCGVFKPDPKTQTETLPSALKVKAKRSKRGRAGSFGWSRWGSPISSDSTLVLTPFNDSTSSSTTASSSSSSSSHSSYLSCDYTPTTTLLSTEVLLPPKTLKLKKRGRKSKSPSPESSASSGERRCSHCGVQKTPQWRAGPKGAKTLCNACGVRYKSGRLLPEYRPACSPTFVNQVHSNSHRKVLEMRRKKEEEEVVLLPSVAPPVASF